MLYMEGSIIIICEKYLNAFLPFEWTRLPIMMVSIVSVYRPGEASVIHSFFLESTIYTHQPHQQIQLNSLGFYLELCCSFIKTLWF